MRISPVRNNLQFIKFKSAAYRTSSPCQNVQSPKFTGLFDKKETQAKEPDISVKDQITSLRIASVLPRLDDKSFLMISQQDNYGRFLANQYLTGEKTILPYGSTPEKFYHVVKNTTHPVIIAKDPQYGFKISGAIKNLSASRGDTSDFRHIYAQYGDIIETADSKRYKLLEIKEQNSDLLCDEYSKENWLKGGRKSKGAQQSKYARKIPDRNFSDIAGADFAIDKIKKCIIYPILYPFAYTDNKNHGTILQGPPGTGKTLLALSLIGELKQRGKNLYLISVDPNELERAHIGETQQLWRSIFDELKNNQPSLLFIDEIDKLFTKRGDGENYLHRNDTLNQFLTLTDEIEKENLQIYIIGATNRPDSLDSAIIRSGRFGNTIELELPNQDSCLSILNLYLKDKNVDNEFDTKAFAAKLHEKGYSGADIAEITAKAKEAMYERCGIYEKMETGTLKEEDIRDLVLSEADFYKVLNNFA